jgi:hypothetical protein
MQIGFTLDTDPKKWYNIDGEIAVLQEIRETLISKGNEIEFDLELGKVGDINLISKAKEENWEDDIVNFETLLNNAHSNGLDEIQTQMLAIDVDKKYALFKAKVHGKKGFFEAHGDATEENVTGTFIKPHFIRMAETRAICRALRWYTNNAACSEEEKGKK